jgi:hypothetical protein
MPEVDATLETAEVGTLKLAAWLRLNGQKLLERRLKPDGMIVYVFKSSDQIGDLIQEWSCKSEGHVRMSRYSSIVSFEIRKAVRIRREHGFPLESCRVLQEQRMPRQASTAVPSSVLASSTR